MAITIRIGDWSRQNRTLMARPMRIPSMRVKIRIKETIVAIGVTQSELMDLSQCRGPLSGGEFVTKPLTFNGNQLIINFSTSAAGSIQVEVQDVSGNAIPGFGLNDCPEVFGDDLERVVTWESGTDVSRLSGQPIRLRFLLKDADLFSMRFS